MLTQPRTNGSLNLSDTVYAAINSFAFPHHFF
jgi:hypothetical protein